MSNPYRASFENDLEDTVLFLKEVLIVVWRISPAGIGAHVCNQLFGAVNESTPADQKALMVAESLSSIEITPVEVFENNFSDAITQVCKGICSEVIKAAAKRYPQVEDYLKTHVGNEEEQLARSFRRLTLDSVQKHRGHYQQLHAYYLQLNEFAPRYSDIMTRSGVFDGAIGFAAGFFGGYWGAVGAEVWGNWRNSTDQEFCQKFGAAFEQFAQACFNYTTQGEESISYVLDQLMDEIRRLHFRLFDCFDQLALAGWDIEPLYKAYRTLEDELDSDSIQLFEIAISNLQDNRSIHYKRIENIRAMMLRQ